MRSITHIVAAIAVLTAGLTGLSTVAIADTGHTNVEQMSSIDVSIEDEEYRVDGIDISGDGLPSVGIDERTYTADSLSIQADGLIIEYDGTIYEVCEVDVTLENVELTVSNVSVNGDG